METETQTPMTESTATTETQTTQEIPTQSAGANETTQTPTPTEPPKDATATPAEGQAPAWAPEFKFKVRDKELEFDEVLKPLISTKEVNEKIKELYLKGYGIEEVKSDRATLQKELKAEREQFTTVKTNIQNLGEFVKNKDFGGFFQALNIPKEEILKYAVEEFKFQQLPAEQKQAVEEQRRLQAEYQAQQKTNHTLQTQVQQMVQAQTQFELDQALSSPDLAPVINQFNARFPQMPDAFKIEVIRRGQYYEQVHKTSPPASQLVQEVLNLVGSNPGSVGQSTGVPQQTQQQGNISQVVHNQNQKPIIPAFAGSSGGKSPARSLPNSIDDLRRIRQERVSQT